MPEASQTANPLEEEALDRLREARSEKASIETDLQNCYFYTAPRRIRRQSSTSTGSNSKPTDDRELQTSFGFEVVDDFMSMLIETFTPREGPWASRKLPPQYDAEGDEDDAAKELNKKIEAEDAKVFDLIRGSNYYAEKGKAGVPDGAIGVIGLLITDPGRGQPVVCTGIPIRELDIDLGPDGRVDFRSITKPTRYRYLKRMVGREIADKLPRKIKNRIKNKPKDSVNVVWAWWRDWDDFGDVVWQHAVLVDNCLVHDARLVGEGSCPAIVGRFGATPDFAWPDGPLVKSLADLVSLDDIRGGLIENIDFTLRPPKAFEDDGVLNLPAEGVRPGELYPKRPSYGKNAFEDIYEPRPIDAAVFGTEHLERRIKRLHYVDFPEQVGKTPPTATQWIDELVQRQRRIGTPGYAFWREEPFDTFQRFRYIGEQRGVVRTMRAIGVPAAAALQPYNPAERAQDSQEISTAVRFAQIGQSIAPTMWQVALDELATLGNLKAKFGDKIIAFRDEAEIKERIATLSQLGANVLGNAGGGEGGPAGGAPA